MTPAFWRGRRVFPTGHTGFKDSWLSLWLQQLGPDVTGFALAPPSNTGRFETAGVARGMRSLQGDICGTAMLRQALSPSSTSRATIATKTANGCGATARTNR